jgi:hypothetical protein
MIHCRNNIKIIRIIKWSESEVFVATNVKTIVIGRRSIVWQESTNILEELST